jgi:hypothetical protein
MVQPRGKAGCCQFLVKQKSIRYQVVLKRVGQKPFNESVASKAIAAGINHEVDPNGQSNGLLETGSENEKKCGNSLAWFRTSACHVDDPGSNPGYRTIIQFKIRLLSYYESKMLQTTLKI